MSKLKNLLEEQRQWMSLGEAYPGAHMYDPSTRQMRRASRLGAPQSIQQSFNPIDYHFTWTSTWYDWDRKKAHAAAMKARNAEAAKLKKDGWKVRKWVHRNQLMRQGGIGTGKPDVEFHVNVYGFNADKEQG